jgi:hypothetical protein
MPANAPLFPLSTKSPEFCLTRLPVPLIDPAKVPGIAWSNTKVASLMMLPCRLVVLPCKVPALIVVPPV